MLNDNTPEKGFKANTNIGPDANAVGCVWKDIVHFVEIRISDSICGKTAEDFAAEAIEYALRDMRIDWTDTKSAKERLYRTARKVAKWRIGAAFKKAQHAIISFDLDTLETTLDGDELEVSPAEALVAEEKHRAYTQYKEMKAMGRSALRRLDDFLHKHGVSLRDVEVYKEWELYNVPTDSVCKRHGIKTSNLHKIVCVVNGILRRCGRDLLKDE